jgi:hypothetical protein
MTPLAVAVITIAFVSAGWFSGSFLRDRIPEHHLADESRDVVKTASGMIATLVALIIGLLVSSAKSSFDQANDGIMQAGTKVILLDRALSRYGSETMPIRGRLKEVVQWAVDRLWPSRRGAKEGVAALERGTGIDEVQDMIERLAPNDEAHRNIKTQALQTCQEVMQSRWLMIEHAQTTLPPPLLVMLIFWLTVLFASLGLLARRNATTISCLFVCAVSMAGAIFLLLEMNRPFQGMIEASPAPLLKAISVIAR